MGIQTQDHQNLSPMLFHLSCYLQVPLILLKTKLGLAFKMNFLLFYL